MDAVTIGGVEENVLTMPVTQTQNIAHHGHHCCSVCICLAARIPTYKVQHHVEMKMLALKKEN